MPRTVTDADLESAFAYAIGQTAKDPRVHVVTDLVDWRNNLGSSVNRIRTLYGVQTHHTGSEISADRIVSYVRSLATGSIRPEIGRNLCNTATVRASHAWPGSGGRPTIVVLNDNYANHSGMGDQRILDELADGDIDGSAEFDPEGDDLYLNRFLWGDEAVGARADVGQQLAFVIFYAHAMAFLGLHVDTDDDGRSAAVIGHRESTDRKVDPAGVDLVALRDAFHAFWADRYGVDYKPIAEPLVSTKPATLLQVDGILGPDTIRALQQWAGVTSDGIIGPNTRKAVQRRLGVTADGIWGRVTITALQRLVGTTPDGVWGKNTTAALQTYLNRTLSVTPGTTTAGPTPTPTAPVPAATVDIRVVTANILSTRFSTTWATRRQILVADLAKLAPDVVLLQEASEEQRDYLRASLPGGATRWKVWPHRESAVLFDSARLSFDTDAVVRVDVKGTGYHGAVAARLTDRKTGAPVTFGSVHLSPAKYADDDLQRAQLAGVLAKVGALGGIRIVGGDLNDKAAPTWAAGYTDARKAAATTTSAATHDGGGTLDHLMSAGRVTWRRFAVQRTAGSDHHLVIGDATIPVPIPANTL